MIQPQFVGYKDASTAKRGFRRKFNHECHVWESLRCQHEGKVGFWFDESTGQPVHPVSDVIETDPQTVFTVNEPEPIDGMADQPDMASDDTFGSFAISQLVSENIPAPIVSETQPASVVTTPVKPARDGICARVWSIATRISLRKGFVATAAEVVKACDDEGINTLTARTQFSKWKIYHGV